MYSLVYGFYYLIQIVLSCIVLEYPSYWKSCFVSFCFVFKLWPSHWGANSFEPLTFKAFHLLSQSAGHGVLFSTVVEKQLHENQNWRNNDMRLPDHYVPFWLVQMSQWLAACSCPAHKGSSVKLVSWRAAHICGFLHTTAKKGVDSLAIQQLESLMLKYWKSAVAVVLQDWILTFVYGGSPNTLFFPSLVFSFMSAFSSGERSTLVTLIPHSLDSCSSYVFKGNTL